MEELGSYQDPVRYKLYARRAEWADVTPLPSPDGNDVVAVQYTPNHADALGYFRAVLQSEELSTRVMRLTTDMIGFNQSDYTAWACRWACAQALGLSGTLLGAEENFTASIMTDNAKNYQLWNYRRKIFIAGALFMPDGCATLEMDFASDALEQDAKNYHAWAHRQAVVAHCGSWHEELEYCDTMIRRDVRNNSAWAQRSFVIQHMLKDTPFRDDTSQGTNRDRHLHQSVGAGVPAQTIPPGGHQAYTSSNHGAAISTSPVGTTATDLQEAETGTPVPAAPHANSAAASGSGQQPQAASTSSLPSQQVTSTPPSRNYYSSAENCSPPEAKRFNEATIHQTEDASTSGGNGLRPFLQHLLVQELVYVTGHMLPAPRNESCWEYFRGLFVLPGTRPHEMGYWEEVHTSCCEALHDCPSCAPALDCLAEYYFHVACLLRLQLAEIRQNFASPPPLLPSAGPSAHTRPPASGSTRTQQQHQSAGLGTQGDVVMDRAATDALLEVSASSSEQESGSPDNDFGADGDEGEEVQAELAAAMTNGIRLLESLLIVDPMRNPYWHHRMRELRAVQSSV